MKQRCSNPNHQKYYMYGGRGIKYDPKWESFLGFLEDMGERPKGMTLDRKDSGKDYSKENCRWATSHQQQNNLKNNIPLTYKGVTLNMSEWERKLGWKNGVIRYRLKRGWSVEKILTVPPFTGNRVIK